MKQVKHDLLTDKYTKVYHEDENEIKFNNAPRHFVVTTTKEIGDEQYESVLAQIQFQEGAIGEHGVNGVMNEDLIAMVITRLEGFQNSKFSCRENAMAITKLEEALLWLRKRTMGREKRNVEGTNEV